MVKSSKRRPKKLGDLEVKRAAQKLRDADLSGPGPSVALLSGTCAASGMVLPSTVIVTLWTTALCVATCPQPIPLARLEECRPGANNF